MIMKRLRILALILWMLSLTPLAWAEEPLKLEIASNYYGDYVEPPDRVFKMRGKYPNWFQVIVVNTSSYSQVFYENEADEGYSSISFEITDENGASNVVRKKRDPDATSVMTSTYLDPGEKRVFNILIKEDTWEGAFKLYKQGSRKFRVRAVYKSNFKTIYSDYYTLEVTG